MVTLCPATTVTTFTGFDERPWLDIDFKRIITEQRSLYRESPVHNLFIYGGVLLLEKMGGVGGNRRAKSDLP